MVAKDESDFRLDESAEINSLFCERKSVYLTLGMRVEFRDEELRRLYEGQRIRSKRFNSNVVLVRNFVKTIDKIVAASNVTVLKQIRSLNLENLVNDPRGYSSVRVDGKYRLILDLNLRDGNQADVVGIVELTNHYR